jgi:hypothetical protein
VVGGLDSRCAAARSEGNLRLLCTHCCCASDASSEGQANTHTILLPTISAHDARTPHPHQAPPITTPLIELADCVLARTQLAERPCRWSSLLEDSVRREQCRPPLKGSFAAPAQSRAMTLATGSRWATWAAAAEQPGVSMLALTATARHQNSARQAVSVLYVAVQLSCVWHARKQTRLPLTQP